MTLFHRFAALTGAVLISSGCLSPVEAAIRYASSVAYLDVSNACYSAAPGDTVLMPPGSATWTNALWLPFGVSLAGSGTNQTVITDQATVVAQNNMIIAVNNPGGQTCLSPDYPTRISNFQIVGAGNPTYSSESVAVITIGSGVDSQPVQWRIDHILFNQCVSHQIIVWNKLGLIDHCYFLMNSPNQSLEAVRVFADLQTAGNYSWSVPYLYGTTNSLYVEANTFDNETPNSANGGVCDVPQGGGMVFRDNVVINSVWCNHGLEGARSCRWWEIYNNTFIATNNTFAECLYAMDFRGGTGVVFSNTIVGYKLAQSTENYRSTTWFGGMGGAYGGYFLDSNSPTIFATGVWTNTSTLCTNDMLVFSGVNWTPNQWQGYTFVDTNETASDAYGYPAPAFAMIISNDTTSLTFYPPKVTGVSVPHFAINSGDGWKMTHLIRALDQIGSGSDTNQALSFSGNELVGSDNQAVETLCWWNNTLNGANCHFGNNGYPNIVEGRDFTNDVPKPNYTPLPYPHPMDTTNTYSYNSVYYTLTVTGGTGGGNFAPGATVSITAPATSGKTFVSWTGDTNYLVSATVAATTLTMPSNAVAVQAVYVMQAGAAASLDITNSLVAQWPLSGDLNDRAGTNNGTAYGAPAFVAGPSGVANSALALNGASQYVQTTTLADWGAGCASGFTVSAWVNTSDSTDQQAVFGSQGASGMAASLYLNYAGGPGAGMIEGIVRDGTGNLHGLDVPSNSGITDGKWHLLTWVDAPAANSGTIYLDGVALNTVAVAHTASATTDLIYPMGLGIRLGLNDFLFNGALADCRVYNRTLSAAEVATLYANGAVVAIIKAPTPPSNLQVHSATP